MAFSSFSSMDRDTAFPLGGIGTGTISIDAAGKLQDFEIFNRPQKGNALPYCFFALHTEIGEQKDTRILQAQERPDFALARGYHPQAVQGLPMFTQSRMTVRYPFCEIDFLQADLPLDVRLTAMNPLIPLDAADSGIPVILFRYRIRNRGSKQAKILLCGSMPNFYGFHGFDCFDNFLTTSGVCNVLKRDDAYTGLLLTGEGISPTALDWAEGALLAEDPNAEVLPYWYKGGWQDGVTSFWNALEQGMLCSASNPIEKKASLIGPEGVTVGSVGIRKVLQPGEAADFTFVMSWYVPNRIFGWFPSEAGGRTCRNEYAVRFDGAWAAGAYLLKNLLRLEKTSRDFADALYSSTLPESVIESAAYSLTVLRSNTCFRTEGGHFWGWEGCHEQEGSCHGTCTHVWNYAQTVAFLFPELERNARLNELLHETNEEGDMCFRSQQMFCCPPFELPPAIDGTLGTLVRVWREYLLGGGKPFLKKVYPAVVQILNRASALWDLDGDGLPEAKQHNTYDIEFEGANPLSSLLYLSALMAVAAMASELGDAAQQDLCMQAFAKSAAALDEKLWNGSYYEQRCPADSRPYQHGTGCLSDQLFGQTLAFLTGLGALVPEEKLRKAATAIFSNNFSDGTTPRWCMQRLFVAPDEAGLRLCSWPKGGKPALPFVYSDEVWTGVEYQVATLLCWLGMTQEAEQIVRSVRARFDGERRNPFNEMECGFHYARSMAAWGLIPAYSGMKLAPDGDTSFTPRICQEHFHCFYSDGHRWGTICQYRDAQGRLVQEKKTLGIEKREESK